MKTPLTLHNLWHQRFKTAVSIGGVAFALLLVFMQLGFMGAVSHTATNLLDKLQFDVLLRARDYLHLYEAGLIDQRSLHVARNTPGVRSAHPMWITIQNWKTMPTQAQQLSGDFRGQYLPIAVMGYQPEQPVFDLPEVEEARELLLKGDAMLLDNSTQVDYGPWESQALFPLLPWTTGRFGEADIGRQTEVGGRLFTVGGLYTLGTGLAANGALITGQRGFARVAPWDTNQRVSLGLIRLESDDPAEQARVVEQLKQRLSLQSESRTSQRVVETTQPAQLENSEQSTSESSGSDTIVSIVTRAEALAAERYRWLWQTPFGLIFQMGVVLSLVVGASIVYMVLATDVANRMSEYATLLAMGYSRLFLASIVMTQAIVLSLLGFGVAWGVAELLYRVTYRVSGIPLMMDAQRILLVAALGVVMCCLSGLLALRKLWKAEPANLF